MTVYYIPDVGYVAGPFKDTQGRSYPANWLKLATQEQLDALGAVPPPDYDPATQRLLQAPGGWQVEDKTQEELDQEQADLEASRAAAFFSQVDAYMEEVFPRNERERLAGALGDPRTPADAMTMIQAMSDWSDACWAQYYELKPQAVTGEEVTFDPDPAPHNFQEIMAVIQGA